MTETEKKINREWRLIQTIFKTPPNGNGQDVELYKIALPTKSYKIVVRSSPNSIGKMRPGFVLETGSGMKKWAEETARHISQGMIELGNNREN